MFEYSSGSRTRISAPPPTTTTVVAVTMTLAAVRTEGGSRRKRDMRRSTRFGRELRSSSFLLGAEAGDRVADQLRAENEQEHGHDRGVVCGHPCFQPFEDAFRPLAEQEVDGDRREDADRPEDDEHRERPGLTHGSALLRVAAGPPRRGG